MIEASAHCTVVYTDHSAAVSTVRQTSLNTTSTEKLNLRLIRASEYLQRFRLDVRYKPGKSASIHWASETKTLLTKEFDKLHSQGRISINKRTIWPDLQVSGEQVNTRMQLAGSYHEKMSWKHWWRVLQPVGRASRPLMQGERVSCECPVSYARRQDQNRAHDRDSAGGGSSRPGKQWANCADTRCKSPTRIDRPGDHEGEALRVAEKVTDEARRVFWEFQTWVNWASATLPAYTDSCKLRGLVPLHQSVFAESELPSTKLPRWELKPYRVQGLVFLAIVFASDIRGGILADEMGLGETITAYCEVAKQRLGNCLRDGWPLRAPRFHQPKPALQPFLNMWGLVNSPASIAPTLVGLIKEELLKHCESFTILPGFWKFWKDNERKLREVEALAFALSINMI